MNTLGHIIAAALNARTVHVPAGQRDVDDDDKPTRPLDASELQHEFGDMQLPRRNWSTPVTPPPGAPFAAVTDPGHVGADPTITLHLPAATVA